MAKRQPKDGMDGLVEWQDHQYDPGHWTGGNTHPIYRRGKGSRRYGYLYIVVSIFLVAALLLVFVGSPLAQGGDASDVLEALPALALTLLVPLAFIVVGIRYVKIGKEYERSAARREQRGTKRRRNRK